MSSSTYGGTVAVLIALLLIEAPAVHIVLGTVMDEGALRVGTQAVLLLSSIYLAVWLLGDLRLLKETAGVLVGDADLRFDVGLRARGWVARTDIVRAQTVPGTEEGDSATDGTTPIRISPMPAPNARVWLRRSVTIRGVFGIPMRGDRLDIYVDDPQGLVQAIGGGTLSQPATDPA